MTDLDDLANLLNTEAFYKQENLNNKTIPPLDNSTSIVQTSENAPSKLKLVDVFKNLGKNIQSDGEKLEASIQKKNSEIHGGDTDSSDDEDNKYAIDHQNYSESGRAIKNALKKQTNPSTSYYVENSSWKSKTTRPTVSNQSPNVQVKNNFIQKDIYSDPFFGIRIITPLISSQLLKEKMVGKLAVPFNRLEKHLILNEKTSDWVLAGVIVSKIIRTSQKGNTYVCWTLTDLREDLKTVSVFLFGKAYRDLWKTNTHTVVAVLNPSPLEGKSTTATKSHIASLSVLNTDQVMIWGQSKDLGTCKARKNNGEMCTSPVNLSQCEFCVFHVKKEYQKFNKRSELQASWGGGLNQLRNKVLGKSEVFYAGKSFTAVPSKPNKKQVAKDQKRLTDLFSKCESRFEPERTKPNSQTLSSRVRLMKDAERLQKLTGSPATLTTLHLERNGSMESISSKKKIEKTEVDFSEATPKMKQTIKSENKANLSKKKSLPKNSDQDLKKLSPKSFVKQALKTRTKADEKSLLMNLKRSNNLPTKNRFESLTKLQSIHGKSDEVNADKSKLKVQDSLEKKIRLHDDKFKHSSDKLKSIDMFDVEFEFDDKVVHQDNNHSMETASSSTNVASRKPTTSPRNLKNTSSPTTDNPNSFKNLADRSSNEQNKKCHDKSFGNCISLESSPKPDSARKIRVSSSSDMLLTKMKSPTCTGKSNDATMLPLGESKSPSKKECQLNISSGKEKKLTQRVFNVQETTKEVELDLPVKRLKDLVHNNSPKLGSLSSNLSMRQSKAKAKALKYVKLNGPIEKEDQRKKVIDFESKRKRSINEESPKDENTLISQRFLELMNATSKHLDLVTNAENEAMDEYYEKMEKKEKMEEKMLSTYKVECKAFKCLKCKYKWFSPSDLCKSENHPIKVVSAVKRFFSCHNCKNRTVSLEVIPLHNCSNCGQANWERAPMMRERKSALSQLSIRGGEQTFVNSVITDTNINLCVPDDS